MPTAVFQPPQGQQSVEQLQDWIIKLVRDLDYYMNNLDTVNISRLDAKVVIAQTITAAMMNVNQLSAIAADLGTITAGIIYGAYIATSNGTYPRIELSSVGNLLTAYFDATHSLSIKPSVGGAPGIDFSDPSGITGRIYGSGGIGLLALVNNVKLDSLSGSIVMNAVTLLFNGVDVMAAINSKAPKGLSGTKTYYVSDTSGGAVTRKLTFTDGVLTSQT